VERPLSLGVHGVGGEAHPHRAHPAG
jgi:hypothetical protein